MQMMMMMIDVDVGRRHTKSSPNPHNSFHCSPPPSPPPPTPLPPPLVSVLPGGRDVWSQSFRASGEFGIPPYSLTSKNLPMLLVVRGQVLAKYTYRELQTNVAHSYEVHT